MRDDRWVILPSHRRLVLLESEDTVLFNMLNVLLSKCYSILHDSLELFVHSSSRIANENWDPVQEVVSTNIPPSSNKSMETLKHGVRSGCVCSCQLRVPMLICSSKAKGWGITPVYPAETSWPPEQDGHVLAPCWELVQGSPHCQHFWVKLRYMEDEVGFTYLRYKVVWSKYSANRCTAVLCKVMRGISGAGRMLGILQEETFLF